MPDPIAKLRKAWRAANAARTAIGRANEKAETDTSLAKGFIILAEENLQKAIEEIEEAAEEVTECLKNGSEVNGICFWLPAASEKR